MRSRCAVGSIVLLLGSAMSGACGGGTLPLNFDAGSGLNGDGAGASGGSTSQPSGSSGSTLAGSGTGSGPSGESSGGAPASGSSTSGSGSGGRSGSASGSGTATGSSGGSSGMASTGSSAGGSSGGGSGAGSGASSGTNASGSTSGAGSGSTDGDASTNPSCPAAVPQAGDSCPRVGFECEYGTHAELACNQLAECASGGWTLVPRGECPVGVCAPDYADITDGAACDPTGLICAYEDGTCNCATRTGPIVGGTPFVRWACVAAEAGCRSPRPNIGSACSDAGHECNYGACSGGIALVCEDGTWQEEHLLCPAQ